MFTTINGIHKIYRNLWTYGTDSKISYFDRIFTVRNKKYILLNDCYSTNTSEKMTILCRYS